MKVLSFCHSSRDCFPFPGFIIFFFTCYVHRMESAKFTVIGPSDPVSAIRGQETVLPCHLSPSMSAANMEVRWFRSDFASFVHLYRDGKDQYDGQMPDYWGRTELLKAGLTDGIVPLRILDIRLADEGRYLCFVQDDTFYGETVLELRVADSFFPRVNPWMVALSVILVVLFCFIGLTVYLFKMKGKLTEDVGKLTEEVGKRDIEVEKRDNEIKQKDFSENQHLNDISKEQSTKAAVVTLIRHSPVVQKQDPAQIEDEDNGH
ncbi:myelin-oligodendrocyte glycoprotein-like [Mauremys reevesii]|uniref:myelin-oligodendrocyte glycoprotein-like n=1 Tax=Mauremys reevesii TaxID=260615 RepID=UPI00193EDF2B|nr:myelin-oligodendrocyte glycoprotein-like [Mauremys reevesii]